jgi:hypothetical protein
MYDNGTWRKTQQPIPEFGVDVYFSADVETDGPIPGPYSMLSFALVFAGTFDGVTFRRPENYDQIFYTELKPISDEFQTEALEINGLDRARLCIAGNDPASAMTQASSWIRTIAGAARPVLVAYPLSFDWAWLYWYFTRFAESGSPFGHSQCYDIKTALAVKGGIEIGEAGRSRVPASLRSTHPHTHNAKDDAVAQAEIFANVFEWRAHLGSDRGT